MSRLIEHKMTADEDEDFKLGQELIAWAFERNLSMDDLGYLCMVASSYTVLCHERGVPALVSASGVAGARVRARARVNKRGR